MKKLADSGRAPIRVLQRNMRSEGSLGAVPIFAVHEVTQSNVSNVGAVFKSNSLRPPQIGSHGSYAGTVLNFRRGRAAPACREDPGDPNIDPNIL